MKLSEHLQRINGSPEASFLLFSRERDESSPANELAGLLAAAIDARESLRRLPDTEGAFRITAIQQLEMAISRAENVEVKL